jgi:hypothetical protein
LRERKRKTIFSTVLLFLLELASKKKRLNMRNLLENKRLSRKIKMKKKDEKKINAYE